MGGWVRGEVIGVMMGGWVKDAGGGVSGEGEGCRTNWI